MNSQAGPSPLSRFVAPIRASLTVACIVHAIGAIAGLVPFFMVVEIAGAFLENRAQDAIALAWIAAIALGLRLICVLAAGYLAHRADAGMQLALRREIANHLMRVPLSWFSQNRSGDLKKALRDDVEALHVLVGHSYTALVGAVTTPVCVVVYLGYVNPLLLPVALFPVLVGMLLYASQMRGMGESMRKFNTALANVNSAAIEYVQGIAIVKIFGSTDRAFARFSDNATAFIDYFWTWIRGRLGVAAATEIILSPLANTVFAAAAGVLFHWLGWIGVVDIVALVALMPALTAPFQAMSFAQNGVVQGKKAARRLAALLDMPALPAPAAPRRPVGVTVVFDAVSAGYSTETNVLSDIDLTLEPETTTALVGPSGSGKTTLARLLPRFWDPAAGTISIGGVPLTDIAGDVLYAHVAFVFQDAQLLHATVRENILIGRRQADQAALEAAARAAQIHDRILALPDGYDTVVGSATRLSGGEAQRITLARAMLSQAPIVVLDEATAHADAETAAAVREALAGWVGNRTVLMIAHDLTSVVEADQICVLDGGRIVERGRHAELLARNALYRRLWDAAESGEAA